MKNPPPPRKLRYVEEREAPVRNAVRTHPLPGEETPLTRRPVDSGGEKGGIGSQASTTPSGAAGNGHGCGRRVSSLRR